MHFFHYSTHLRQQFALRIKLLKLVLRTRQSHIQFHYMQLSTNQEWRQMQQVVAILKYDA